MSGGRRPACPHETIRRMYELHYAQHVSYQRIALVLNAEGVPLPLGGARWCKSSVVRVMYSNYGKAIGRDLGLYV
ncbi:MAG TPA: hypothetical protein VMU95_41990 [Trebonia sp.]|nr:hypothetical protein [Trebonia sp.]